MNYFNNCLIDMFWCIKETSLEMFLLRTKNMLDIKTPIIIILGGYIFLCLPPYYSNFRYFEIKPQGHRTTNLRDLTVFLFRNSFPIQ